MSRPHLRKRWLSLFLAAALASLAPAPFSAEEPSEPPALDRAVVRSLAEKWGKNLVAVQLWLKRSEGQEPPSAQAYEAWTERRPLEVSGLAVDARTVWLPEPDLQERFIARIAIGARETPARMRGWFVKVPGWILECAEAIPGIEPIAFAAPEEAQPFEKLTALGYTLEKGRWIHYTWPSQKWFRIQGKAIESPISPGMLLIDRDRGPVGYAFSNSIPLEAGPGLWFGRDIAASPILTAEAMEKLRQLFAEKAAVLSPTARVYFRREEEADEERRYAFYSGRYGRGVPNDVFVSSLAVGPRLILVHLALERENAMRLSRVTLSLPDGPREARFLGAFKDFGAFLAETDGDLPGFLDLSGETAYQLLQPLIAVAADHSTGKRQDRVEFRRVAKFERCYKNVLEPILTHFPRLGSLLFSAEDHTLAGAVIEVRRGEEEWASSPGAASRYMRYSGDRGRIDLRVITVGELRRIVESAPGSFDRRLRPLPAEREKDMVWFGVEYQPMNGALARARGVEISTRGGQFGLLVISVYPDSPAAKGGIQPGDILLTLQEPDKPEPTELDDSEASYSSGGFLDELDEEDLSGLSDEELSGVPAPWPSQQNYLNAQLTQIGEGSEVEIRYLRDGKESSYRFRLQLGPPSHENAPKEKVRAIGLTVKDLTYEVRSHYRLPEDCPGVVVAYVESGSPAAVAKLRRYEIITSVNGEPVRSAKEFREKVEAFLAASGGKDLELKVERLGKARIVKIRT